MHDDALLDALAAADPVAIEALERRYGGRLRAVVATICGAGFPVAELVHDVVVDFALDHAPRLREPAAIGRYLRVMAVRRAVRLRDRGRRHGPVGEALSAGDPSAAWAAAVDAPGRHARLADCLAELPPRTGRMLRMRFGRDATTVAIGEALGVSKQYVSRVINDALARLRRCMTRGRG